MNKFYKISIVLTFLISTLFVSAQRSQEYIIETITVSGIKHLDQNTIIATSELQVGDTISIPGIEIPNAVRKIWSENIVGNVIISATEYNGDKVSLNIELTERPRLSDVIISGVKKSEEKDLDEAFDFVKSQVVSEALKKNIKLKIEEFFKSEGFYGVQVSNPQETADTSISNHVFLTYNVTKGTKYKIDSLVVLGANQVEPKKVKRKLKNTKERKFYRIWKRSKFIQEDYNEDEDNLMSHYQSLGMRDAEINLDTVYAPIDTTELDKNGEPVEGGLYVQITVSEGQVYHYRDITWTGNSKYSDKELSEILGVQKGDVYNQAELDSKLNFNPNGIDVSSLYLDDGYLFFSVNPVEIRVEGDSIDVEMRIYEGNQATIGKVTISGNTKTSDHVIMREITTLPGDKFSRTSLIRSQQIIASLGFFDPEQIQIIPVPNQKTGTVDIEYIVVEKSSDQLTLSGGWGGGGNIGFVGTLGLVFNNFSLRNIGDFKNWDPLPSGDGQRLSIQAQSNGPSFQQYSLSFTEPWLGGRKPNSFTVSANHSRFGRLNSDDKLSISGASVSLGRRLRKLDDFFSLSNSLSYSYYVIDNYGLGATEDILCSECNANNLNFTTTLARNTAGPNVQYPTEGSNVSLSLSLTPPYSLIDRSIEERTGDEAYKLIEYHKWMFDFTSYLKLGSRRRQSGIGVKSKKERPFVLQTRFHFGYIGRYNQNATLSPFERFRLGGTGINGFVPIIGTEIVSLRGYTEDALFPEGGGGTIYNKLVMELRYPFVTEGIATVYGFGFFEAGNNWASARDFNPLDLKRSVGAGVTIFMPAFGNISLGYGWGLDDTPFDNGGDRTNGAQFLFAIGASLR